MLLERAALSQQVRRAIKANPVTEGFVVEEIIRAAGERNAYFWATQAGAKLDLLLMLGGQHYGVEIKYADAPGMTKSMRIALRDLKLKRLFVAYPGAEKYDLDKRTVVIPLDRIRSELLSRRRLR